MMRPALPVCVLAIIAALLSVSSAWAATARLRGPQLFTSIVLDADQNDPLYCPMRTRGRHHEVSPGPGQAIVGYANFYDPGSGPFPCWEKIDHAYRAHVRFKPQWLARYKRPSRVDFQNAYLTFRVQAGQRTEGAVAYEKAFWSAAHRLGVLTSPWTTIGEDGRHRQGDAFTPATFSLSLPTGSKAGGPRLTQRSFKVNVTGLVVDWICGRQANHGFVLKGPNESFSANNDRYLSVYSSFELMITGVGARKYTRHC